MSRLQISFKDIKHDINSGTPLIVQPPLPFRSRFLWAKSPSVTCLKGSITSFQKTGYYEYYVTIILGPLLWSKLVRLDLRLSSAMRLATTTTSPSFAFGFGMQIKNLVPDDSDIMVACERGDISTVWDLFQGGKASINDITLDNRTPLLVCTYALLSGC
jgi:hypothetical protein